MKQPKGLGRGLDAIFGGEATFDSFTLCQLLFGISIQFGAKL